MFGRSTAQQVMDTVAETASQAQEMLPPARDAARDLVGRIEDLPADTYVDVMAATFVASALLMLLGRERGRHWSLFLGIWAPAILGLGMYRRHRSG